MDHPQDAGSQIVLPVVGIDQLDLAPERERHRVDREVAARQIDADRRRRDLGQRPGPWVALAPGPRQVDLAAADRQRCGPEALVAAGLDAEPIEHRVELAVDGDVELGRLATAERVADSAADQVAGGVGERLEQRCGHGLAAAAQQ